MEESPRATEMLPCELSGNEIRERGERMALVVRQIDSLEEEKAAVSARISAKIKQLKPDVSDLAQQITSGQEVREVVVEYRKNFKEGTLETVNVKTGELVRERTLTEAERQLHIIDDAPSAATEPDAKGGKKK